MQYRFLGKRKIIWFSISLAILLAGIAALIIWWLPLGIDFRGGAEMDVKFTQNVTKGDLQNKLSSISEARGVTVVQSDGGVYAIRVLPISDTEHNQIISQLKTDFGDLTEQQYASVGPSVSSDLTRKAFIAVALASIMILLFLAYSFRTVSYPVSSWKFGATALAALLHDLLITAGVFAILAHFLKYEVDTSFITALLTVMGFSVHDTIVVFDRIRENLAKTRVNTAEEFEQLTEGSLADTLNRSLSTSLTVLFTLTALTVLGGPTIRPFILALLTGVTIGTYSSIFTATPLLVIWQNSVFNRLENTTKTNK